MLLFGSGWSAWKLHSTDEKSLIQYIGYEKQLMHVHGRIESSETKPNHTTRHIQLAVDTIVCPDRPHINCSGQLTVRLHGDKHLPTGSRIAVVGWVQRPSNRSTGRDWISYARWTGRCGWMEVPDTDLVQLLHPENPHQWFHVHRGRLQMHVTRALERGVEDVRVRSMMNLLITGVRTPGWREVSEPFRRTGVAHLLAISGLHLCLFTGVFLYVLIRMFGQSRIMGPILITLILIYLLVVQWRPPVLRAACMLGACGLGWTLCRHVSSIGLLSCAAMALLLWKPGNLFLPGFQLSMLVVAAIIMSMGAHQQQSTGVLKWTRAALRVSWVSWLTATPIILFHFQIISPLGAIISVLMIPPTTILLILGFTRVAVGWMHQWIDVPLRMMIEWGGRVIIDFVEWIDHFEWSSFEVQSWPLWSTVAWLIIILLWLRFNVRDLYWSYRQWWRRRRSSQMG